MGTVAETEVGPEVSSVLSMKSFSAEVLGQERMPFLSVQHRAVMEPKACIKFSVRDKYLPWPRIAFTNEVHREDGSEAFLAFSNIKFGCWWPEIAILLYTRSYYDIIYELTVFGHFY